MTAWSATLVFLLATIAALGIQPPKALTSPLAQLDSERDPWYFTADEIATAYRFQANFGERVYRPLSARDCLFGTQKIWVSDRWQEFLLSCRFVKEAIRHIAEMLDAGAARYLFPLDADHAHLAVPREIWEAKYSKLPRNRMFPAYLEDPALVALYHTAEHLAIADPKTAKVNNKVKAWKEKRNVLGFFDGRPIRILPPNPSGSGVGLPSIYEGYSGFKFLASPQGQLSVFHKDQAVVFDISLEFGDSNDDSFPATLARQPAN